MGEYKEPWSLRRKLLDAFLWIECHVFLFHHVTAEMKDGRPIRYYCWKCGLPFDNIAIGPNIMKKPPPS